MCGRKIISYVIFTLSYLLLVNLPQPAGTYMFFCILHFHESFKELKYFILNCLGEYHSNIFFSYKAIKTGFQRHPTRPFPWLSTKLFSNKLSTSYPIVIVFDWSTQMDRTSLVWSTRFLVLISSRLILYIVSIDDTCKGRWMRVRLFRLQL